MPRGFASEKVTGHTSEAYRFAFATDPIAEGEIVAVWAGEVVTSAHVQRFGSGVGRTTVQIDEDLYLCSNGHGFADWINHSCDPNLGLRGQIVLVARRPIAVGEELCLDYAMTDGSPYDEFDCRCGTTLCRGRITGDDWQRPELQARYRGSFSPYLERRIAGTRN